MSAKSQRRVPTLPAKPSAHDGANIAQNAALDPVVVDNLKAPADMQDSLEKKDTPGECSNCSAACFQIQDRNEFKAKVEQASIPVIVDFYATWCDPCKALTPRLEAIINQMNGKVQLAKVDIDEMTDLAMDYKISSVPVLIRMIDGKEQDRMVGLQNVATLEAFIDNLDDKQGTKEKDNAPKKPQANKENVTKEHGIPKPKA